MKYIDLTHTLSSDIPSWDGGCCFEATVSFDYKDSKSPNLFRINQINAKAGCGTHLDAPAHCIPGGKTIDTIELDSLVVDCIVIDVSARADENYVAMPDVIEKFEKENMLISENCFVIFYTGWSKHWNNRDQYRNSLRFPSIHESTAKILVERNVVGLGIDTLSPDAIGEDFPVHRVILGAGKFIVENIANADKLPITGSKVSILPIKIKDATEAPLRLIALIK
jgi:kynurenine formamidase